MSYILSKLPALAQQIRDIIDNNPNEHHPELVGLDSGLNQFAHLNSSPRQMMFGQHLSQYLICSGRNPRTFYSGQELCYAEGTWKTKTDSDVLVRRVIPRFSVGGHQFKYNPSTTIIYQETDRGGSGKRKPKFGVLKVDKFLTCHENFGYYQKLSIPANLRDGKLIPAGTVLASSPAVSDDGEWMPTVKANVANISMIRTTEDGVAVRRGWLEKLRTTISGMMEARWGKTLYPLNLYGDERVYKPFPEPGDRIRDDGLIFALRKVNPETSVMDTDPVSMSQAAIDPATDILYYGEAGAFVYDVEIRKSHVSSKTRMGGPQWTDERLVKIHAAQARYYKELIDFDQEVMKLHHNEVEYTPELDNLLRKAYDHNSYVTPSSLCRTYRTTPLDDWMVTVHYSHEWVPDICSKITGIHGDKAVITHIFEDEDAPIDEYGNVVDICTADNTVISRMNIGRLMEPFLHGTVMYFARKFANLPEDKFLTPVGEMPWFNEALKAQIISTIHPKLNEFVEFMGLLSPMHAEKMFEFDEQTLLEEAVNFVIAPRAWLPTNSPNLNIDLVKDLQERYPYPKTRLTFTDIGGKPTTTVDPIRIGAQEILELEKIGTQWAAVADDAKAQIYGPPAKLSASDKFSYPWKRQPTKALSEAEIRLIYATCGGRMAQRLTENQNNPAAIRQISHRLLKEKYPSAISNIIDDTIVAPGYSSVKLVADHLMMVGGIRYARRDANGNKLPYPTTAPNTDIKLETPWIETK